MAGGLLPKKISPFDQAPQMPDNRQVQPVSLRQAQPAAPVPRTVVPVSIQQPQQDWGATTVPMVPGPGYDGVNPLSYLQPPSPVPSLQDPGQQLQPLARMRLTR